MDGVTDYLLTQGVLGIANIVQAFIIVKIYNENKQERANKDALAKELRDVINKLQEARRIDAVETREQVTSILPGISQSLKNISDKIELSKASYK